MMPTQPAAGTRTSDWRGNRRTLLHVCIRVSPGGPRDAASGDVHFKLRAPLVQVGRPLAELERRGSGRPETGALDFQNLGFCQSLPGRPLAITQAGMKADVHWQQFSLAVDVQPSTNRRSST